MDQQSPNPQPEEKRIGLHPVLVIFGVIIGLWAFIALIIPKSKSTQQTATTSSAPPMVELDSPAPELVPIFEVTVTVPEMNAIGLLVPPQTTDSQIMALIAHLRKARMDHTLATILPPTTPNNELGEFAIADIYIFSEPAYAVADALRVLGRGAHAPGEFYPSSIPFEEAMEHVRGHYAIDLYNRTHPETASLGFGETETGVYAKRYQPLF